MKKTAITDPAAQALRTTDITLERNIIASIVASRKSYDNSKDRLCPFDPARIARRPDFHHVIYNNLYEAVAACYESMPGLTALPKAQLKAILIDWSNVGRVTEETVEKLLIDIEEDLYSTGLSEAELSSHNKGKQFDDWLDTRLAHRFVDNCIAQQRGKNPLTLAQIKNNLNHYESACGRGFGSLPPSDDVNTLISNDEVCMPEPIIPGIMDRSSKISLSASSKAQKTWLAMDLALSVAEGMPWQGFPTIKTPVLYVNLEIERGYFRDRLRVLANNRLGSSALTGEFVAWSLRGSVISFAEFLPHLIQKSLDMKAGLIIIDPIYKLLTGKDENSTGDISLLCNEFDRLAKATNAGILYVAHYSKGNQSEKRSIDRISGSGVFSRDADTIVNLTQHEESNCYSVEFTLRNHKSPEPFVVEWKYPVLERREDLDAGKLKTFQSRAAAQAVPDKLIMDSIPKDDASPVLASHVITELQALGYTLDATKAALEKACAAGRIFKRRLPTRGAPIAYHQQEEEVK